MPKDMIKHSIMCLIISSLICRIAWIYKSVQLYKTRTAISQFMHACMHELGYTQRKCICHCNSRLQPPESSVSEPVHAWLISCRPIGIIKYTRYPGLN